MVKIIDGRTNMRGDQVKKTSPVRRVFVAFESQGQMFLTRLFRNQAGLSHNQTMWHTNIHSNSLMPRIAGNDPLARLADDARDDKRGRSIACRQLLQASHIAVDNGSG